MQHRYPIGQLKYVLWKKKHEWFRYSPHEDADYCAHCLAFDNVKGSNFSFLTKGFTNWNNAVGEKTAIIPWHSLTVGHQRATELAEDCPSVVHGNKKNIGSVIS